LKQAQKRGLLAQKDKQKLQMSQRMKKVVQEQPASVLPGEETERMVAM